MRRAIAAQIRHDHPVACGRQHGRDIDKAVNIVRPAMQQNDGGTVGGAGLGITDIEQAGIDLLQRAERGVRARLDLGQFGRFCLADLRIRRTAQGELGGCEGHRGGAEKAAAVLVDVFGSFDRVHGWPSLAHSSALMAAELKQRQQTVFHE
jgi:hypothetical protein